MKRYLFYITALIIPLLLSQCEKIIDINLPDRDRKIVFNGMINPDSLVTVNLTRSLSVLEPDSFVFLDGAKAWLSEGGEKIGDLVPVGNGNYLLPGFYPSMGEEYRLDVEFDGLQPAYAITAVPEPVPLGSVDTSSTIGEYGETEYQLKIRFMDPADDVNYYALVLYATNKRYDYLTGQLLDSLETHQVYFSLTDPVSDESSVYYGGKTMFNDLLFNGRERLIELSFSDYSFFMADTVWLEVKLEQIEPSYFLYATSSQKYYETFRNPFSEPVQVFTNVTGGFGIFSGYASDSKTLVMPMIVKR